MFQKIRNKITKLIKAEEKAEIFKTRYLPVDDRRNRSKTSPIGPKCQMLMLRSIAMLDQDILKEIAWFIYENREHFTDDIENKAIEIITGYPVGKFDVASLIQTRLIVDLVRPGTKLEVTFREDAIKKLDKLFSLTTQIQFCDQMASDILLKYVATLGGDWDGRTRTYTIALTSYTREDREKVAQILLELVESIEIKCSESDLTIEDPCEDPVVDLMKIDFDADTYIHVLEGLGRSVGARHWMRNLHIGSKPREIIRSIPKPLRAHFWKVYCGARERMLVTG